MTAARRWALWSKAHLLPWALLILVLEIVSRAIPGFPSIFSVLQRAFVENLADPGFTEALIGSLRRMLIGYSGVCLLGIGAGALLGRFRWLDNLMGTLIAGLNAMPGAAWVPLAVVIFGFNEAAVIFTVLLGATGIVMVNTSLAIRDVPPLILRAARTMGAKGPAIFWHVVIPSAIPRMVDGLRLAWAFGWRALMAGELLVGSVHGMGQLINEVAKQRNTEQLLAFMVVIMLVGMFVDGVIFNRLIGDRLRSRWGTS